MFIWITCTQVSSMNNRCYEIMVSEIWMLHAQNVYDGPSIKVGILYPLSGIFLQ
jgi:hypothetical protein